MNRSPDREVCPGIMPQYQQSAVVLYIISYLSTTISPRSRVTFGSEKPPKQSAYKTSTGHVT
eukprot:scaffold7743_cov74-Cyclotella_meneghiniana.AAC.9